MSPTAPIRGALATVPLGRSAKGAQNGGICAQMPIRDSPSVSREYSAGHVVIDADPDVHGHWDRAGVAA